MNRLGARPLVALFALLLTALTVAGAGLTLSVVLVHHLGLPLGESFPGGGRWRVVTSCALAGLLTSMLLLRVVADRPRRAAASALAALLVVGLAGFTALCGEVTIVQFSPDRFEARTRTYHEIPELGWRITPEQTTYHLQEVSTYLEAQGHLARSSREEARWLPCRQSRWGVRYSSNNVRYLERELRGRSPVAMAWSEENPDAARTMWREVVRAARASDFWRATSALQEPWR